MRSFAVIVIATHIGMVVIQLMQKCCNSVWRIYLPGGIAYVVIDISLSDNQVLIHSLQLQFSLPL